MNEYTSPFVFVFSISPLDDMNTLLFANKCSEKEEEMAKYSKLIICPLVTYIYFRVKEN